MKNTIIAQDKEHLKKLIAEEIELYGNNCDLNHINTVNVTDMSFLFNHSKFNGDLSQWNVRNVTNMYSMFENSQFNQDISQWDVSNVTDMYSMFESSQFDGDISQWDVSNVKRMDFLFYDCACNQPWWAIKDNDKRKIAIDKYHFMKKLENQLIQKDMTQPKKIKL